MYCYAQHLNAAVTIGCLEGLAELGKGAQGTLTGGQCLHSVACRQNRTEMLSPVASGVGLSTAATVHSAITITAES